MGPTFPSTASSCVLKTTFLLTARNGKQGLRCNGSCLIVVAPGKAVAEPSQEKIKLSRLDRDGFTQGDVESAADNEIRCVIARSRGGDALSGFRQILCW